jgi:hypothetical protein
MLVSARGTIRRNSGLRMARFAPSEPDAFLQSTGPETACNDASDLVSLMIADIRPIWSRHSFHMRGNRRDREGPFNGRRVVGGHSAQIGRLFIRLSRQQTPSYQSCSSTGPWDCNSRARRGPGWARARNAPSAAGLQTISYEDALRNKVIIGTPASVAMRLQYLAGKLGLNGVLAELNCGGLLGNEKVMRSPQLMCEEVAPCFALKKAGCAFASTFAGTQLSLSARSQIRNLTKWSQQMSPFGRRTSRHVHQTSAFGDYFREYGLSDATHSGDDRRGV